MAFQRQFSAGGVVYKRQNSHLYFLVIKHSGHKRWVLPKGWIDKGEKKEETAENCNFPLIEGTKETLLKIKENNQKACFISTNTRESMDSVLKKHNLESLIDFSISGDEVKNYKPDPEGIVKTLKYFNAEPDEAIFIGDSLHDLGAARNANVKFIGVLSGVCTKLDWERERVTYVPSVKESYAL